MPVQETFYETINISYPKNFPSPIQFYLTVEDPGWYPQNPDNWWMRRSAPYRTLQDNNFP
jgi:hypothetical protein